MKKNTGLELKIISLLLQYPDESVINHLPLLAQSIQNMPRAMAAEKLVQFLSFLKSTPLIRLQEIYTETFDLNPSTCLNLTYHIWGDSDNRGKMLAQLQEIYCQAGYETITGELPDYLPLILEFLSEHMQTGTLLPLWLCLGAVEKPAGILKDAGNPYSALLETVTAFVREYQP